jgi:hypothetical protein
MADRDLLIGLSRITLPDTKTAEVRPPATAFVSNALDASSLAPFPPVGLRIAIRKDQLRAAYMRVLGEIEIDRIERPQGQRAPLCMFSLRPRALLFFFAP